MELVEDLYKEELLEHYRDPQNHGELENPDIKYRDFNPLCGDEVEIFMKVKDDVIDEIKFTGKGCAISQAAASIVTEHVKGKKLQEVIKMSNQEMQELLPIEVDYLRIKCALLALKAIQKGGVMYEGGRK